MKKNMRIKKYRLAQMVGMLMLAMFPLSLVVSSCTEPIDFNGKETEPYAVLRCTAEPDSALKVRMTWSRFFLASEINPYKTIDNADLRITSNGVPLALLGADSGNYQFNYVVQEGDVLEMHAKVPGYNKGELSARAVVPTKPAIQVLDVRLDTLEDVYGEKQLKYSVRIRLDDPKEEENYYSIRLRYLTKDDESYPDSVEVRWINCWISCSDPLLIDPSVSVVDIIDEGGADGNETDVLLFSDGKINGMSHDFTVQFTLYGYYGKTDAAGKAPSKLHLMATSYSPELYRYRLSAESAYYHDEDFFSEPVQVICNVQNGIGCFGAQATKNIVFPVK